MGESVGLYGNNVALLQALAMLAPELNVRISLVNLIDFLADLQPGDTIERDDLYEVIAENVVWLHDHVTGDQDSHEADEEEGLRDAPLDEAVLRFRKQLGLDNE